MNNVIIFCVDVDCEESYGLLANFIYKRENHLELSRKEVQYITYKYYLNTQVKSYQEWAAIVAEDRKFVSVKRPQDIKNITEKYKVIYCVRVSKNADIVDMHNLFLIQHYYSALEIFVLFNNFTESQYYTISQFLYRVNILKKDFYNACFFVNNGTVKRAQLKNIDFSRSFIPLQIVEKGTLERLFQDNQELLEEKYLHDILTNEKVEGLEAEGDLIEGAIKLLHDVRKLLGKTSKAGLIRLIRGMDIFSFILLCYAACINKETFDTDLLEEYAFEMKQYSGAIRQLAENIVFHSKTGVGTIAFRVHKKGSEYIKKQYHTAEGSERYSYLEIIVSDFCDGTRADNIAENFISNLESGEAKMAFAGLTPEDFFSHTDTSKEIWRKFYEDPDNIGKHFGLRIFQSIVSDFHGFFGAESHSGYKSQTGDSFLSYGDNIGGNCMPGTRYHIVFRIEPTKDIVRNQDMSLDSGIHISNNIRPLLNFCTDEMELNWQEQLGGKVQSQQNKNKQIRQLSENMQKQLEKNSADIMYLSMADAEEHKGEVIAKALIMALYHMKRDIVAVLYQCTDQMKRGIFDTLHVFFADADIEGMFWNRKTRIVLFSENFEETVIDLSSADNTDNINAYISHVKCVAFKEWITRGNRHNINLERGAKDYIPCDVLHEVEISGKRQTLFEHYTEMILERNIQTEEFGCKFEHTHMRLGSTIHIDDFYEAEILFNNKLFVSRFALLLVKEMLKDIADVEKLTLYGYGTYSETVLVQMVEMIQNYYPQKKDIDYIILEREEERRGFLHKDRLRYNRVFESREERIKYFKDRKVAIIVLINSTLKTHVRLINLFRDENGKEDQNDNWLIRNYAVLLVGAADGNLYWKLEDKKRVALLKGGITPVPRYFIQLPVDYQEPMKCEYCFPENAMAETPLIEVNAASTIPNQAFGITETAREKMPELDYQWISREEEKIAGLKGGFIYGHIQRNENHFLYYFKTEEIGVREREKIRESLYNWKEQNIKKESRQYNIIVAPMHFSNAGFVELVNNVIFDGNAILLRVDFDKEYRCNAYAKFSYLRSYVEQLKAKKTDGVICVHFVDDAIISGRAFYRAKSLIESVLDFGNDQQETVKIKIFDKVFVLVDRNSAESRRQYVKCVERDYYAYIHVNVSSLRNHGNSCVFCNLKNEADLLRDTASTAAIANYWEHCAQKFELCSLEEHEEKQNKDQQRAFRRLFCTHMAQCVLKEKYHGNDKVQTMYLILRLLNTDYKCREEDQYEYFLSYLKCISRPFLVFKKSVKEAIFDILLLLIDATIRGEKLRTVIKEAEEKKKYLAERKLILQFNTLDKNILQDQKLTVKDKDNLVKLLMKQLTELKSNYIIRPEKMDAIFAYMRGKDEENFKIYYMTLIDRLIGASSDTNKSIWLDKQIAENEFKYVPREYQAWIILENTRAFRDGIEKFYIEKASSEEFRRLSDDRISLLKESYDYSSTEKKFKNYMRKHKSELEDYSRMTDLKCEAAYIMRGRIKQFVRGLPPLKTLNFQDIAEALEKGDENWSHILEKEYEILQEELESRKGKEEEKEERLQKLISCELDVYQYGNFYEILRRDGYWNSAGITTDGMDMIVCCTKILDLCRNADMKIIDKVRELALLFKVILRAQKVQFIVENREDNNLDEWKREIENRYNRIVESWNKDHEEHVEQINIGVKKHYTVIVEQSGTEDYDMSLDETTEKFLDQLNQRNRLPHNYIIDNKTGSVIWRLENKARCIWINIQNDRWCEREGGDVLVTARDMRRVMVFYQELKKEIFNPENDDFINEIVHIQKELNIYNSNKVYSHAKDYPQKMQYDQMLCYFSGNDREKYMEYYPSYVLNLLADMNVSKYYRYGLRRKIYDDTAIKRPAAWNDFSALLDDGKEFIYRFSGNEKVSVKLMVSGIDKEDKMLCRSNSHDALREFMLLIYALILNAAEQGRGKRQSENKAVQLQEESVIVKLYKEGDVLIMENECEEPADLERVKRALHRIPESEEDGISLWSFNYYIKRCINSLIREKLKEVEAEIAENRRDNRKICNLGKWIMKLTGEECMIQAETYERDDRVYFKLKVPVFMEKYYWGEDKNEGGIV